MQIFKIFEEILGVDQEMICIRTRKISSGTQNNGIFLHCADVISNGALKESKILQKSVLKEEGIQYHKFIESLSSCKDISFSVPKLYAVEKTEIDFSMHMEYVKGLTAKKLRRFVKGDSEQVSAIARILCDISCLVGSKEIVDDGVPCIEVKERIDFDECLRRLSGISHDKEEVNKVEDLLRNLRNCEEKINSHISSLPVVFCHDDFNWNNLILLNEGMEKKYYVIDWDKPTFNLIGADLYQFIFYEADAEESSSLYYCLLIAMVDFYNKKHDLTVEYDDVLVFAYLYCIERLLTRYFRSGKKRYLDAICHIDIKLRRMVEEEKRTSWLPWSWRN